jgi:hypothetical protein
MRYRLYAAGVVAGLCLAGTSAAQESSALSSSVAIAADTVAVRVPQASSIDRPSEAVRRTDFVAAAPMPATGQKLGEAKTEMIVGGAAFVLGAIMDNDAGSILMVGGAILGLYGLWNYLK